MKIKKQICFIIFLLLIFFLDCNSLFALNELSNKLEVKKRFSLTKYNREILVKASQEQIFNLKTDHWTIYKYAFESGINLIPHIFFSLEYKYFDKKGEVDKEEITNNLYFCYELPLNIELKDENKYITNIRNSQHGYENEIELCRQIIKFDEERKISLLLGDVICYDFEDDKWSENESLVGFEMSFNKNWKWEIKYSYVDVLDDPKNSSGIKTKIIYCF